MSSPKPKWNAHSAGYAFVRPTAPTGGKIRHEDGTIDYYAGKKPSRYSRKGEARHVETQAPDDQTALERSTAASTSE